VKVLVEHGVTAVEDGALICSNGARVEFDECVWCTQAGAQPWLQESGLQLDKNGFIMVDETLQSVNTPGVFAAGDIAALKDPRPKAGVFAVRAGPPLTANIRKVLVGDTDNLEHFIPQQTFLGIIGTVRAFRQNFTIENGIGSYACSLEALEGVRPMAFLMGGHFLTGLHCKLRPNTEGTGMVDLAVARCAFSDRNLHSRMPLDPMHVHLKPTCV
jgi:NADH dehydrogenase FAD-containing subunit